jgi:hypothetical protein
MAFHSTIHSRKGTTMPLALARRSSPVSVIQQVADRTACDEKGRVLIGSPSQEIPHAGLFTLAKRRKGEVFDENVQNGNGGMDDDRSFFPDSTRNGPG